VNPSKKLLWQAPPFSLYCITDLHLWFYFLLTGLLVFAGEAEFLLSFVAHLLLGSRNFLIKHSKL